MGMGEDIGAVKGKADRITSGTSQVDRDRLRLRRLVQADRGRALKDRACRVMALRDRSSNRKG